MIVIILFVWAFVVCDCVNGAKKERSEGKLRLLKSWRLSTQADPHSRLEITRHGMKEANDASPSQLKALIVKSRAHPSLRIMV